MSWISWPITTIRAAEMALTGSNRSYLQFNTLLHLVLEAKAEHKKNKEITPKQLYSDTQGRCICLYYGFNNALDFNSRHSNYMLWDRVICFACTRTNHTCIFRNRDTSDCIMALCRREIKTTEESRHDY